MDREAGDARPDSVSRLREVQAQAGRTRYRGGDEGIIVGGGDRTVRQRDRGAAGIAECEDGVHAVRIGADPLVAEAELEAIGLPGDQATEGQRAGGIAPRIGGGGVLPFSSQRGSGEVEGRKPPRSHPGPERQTGGVGRRPEDEGNTVPGAGIAEHRRAHQGSAVEEGNTIAAVGTGGSDRAHRERL